MPVVVAKPTTLDQLCEAVSAEPTVQAVGGRTKTALSAPLPGATEIDVTGLSGVIEYEPGEYTFTAYAGTRLSIIAAVLAEHGQFLPFDPPLMRAGATLGGTVAGGLSGPGRYRYGGVRDFILGVRYVDCSGELIRAGGKVVKNAAGFDIPKLMAGSLGMFGVLAELTFKVFPAPQAYATLVVQCIDPGEAVDVLQPGGRLGDGHPRGRSRAWRTALLCGLGSAIGFGHCAPRTARASGRHPRSRLDRDRRAGRGAVGRCGGVRLGAETLAPRQGPVDRPPHPRRGGGLSQA